MVSKENPLKQVLVTALKILLAGGLIYWLIASGRFDLENLKKISSPWVWLTGVLMFLSVVTINSKRWQVLLQAENFELSFLMALRLSLMGIFFNFFMPGGVGGDVVKAGYLMRTAQGKKWFIGWSILVDRIFGLMALMLYSGVAGVLFYKELPEALRMGFFTTSWLILIGFAAVCFVLILSPKDKIDRFLRSHNLLEKVVLPLFFFFQEPKRVLLPLILSLMGQGIVIAMAAFVVGQAGISLPLWMILLVFPFGFLATIVPISPGGVGVGQTAFYYLFEVVSGSGETGVLIITFFQVAQFLVGLIGGLMFVLYKKSGV